MTPTSEPFASAGFRTWRYPLIRRGRESSSMPDIVRLCRPGAAALAVGHYLQHLRSCERSDSVPKSLEDRFVQHAAYYAALHGVDYETWRHVGVPTSLLVRAGVVHHAPLTDHDLRGSP